MLIVTKYAVDYARKYFLLITQNIYLIPTQIMVKKFIFNPNTINAG